jgi:hypothetical protein
MKKGEGSRLHPSAFILHPSIMTRATRRSGVVLVVLGVLGGLYFWLSDPRYGPEARATPQGAADVRHWLYRLRGSPQNPVDAANTAWLSTAVGLAGSLTVLGIGGWLLTRRAV